MESVRIGLGVTLISRDAVAIHLADGSLEEWGHPSLPLDRAWHLVAAASQPLGGAAERFLDHALSSGWRRP